MSVFSQTSFLVSHHRNLNKGSKRKAPPDMEKRRKGKSHPDTDRHKRSDQTQKDFSLFSHEFFKPQI